MQGLALGISILAAFAAGYFSCWIANIKDEEFDELMSNDDYKDRVG